MHCISVDEYTLYNTYTSKHKLIMTLTCANYSSLMFCQRMLFTPVLLVYNEAATLSAWASYVYRRNTIIRYIVSESFQHGMKSHSCTLTLSLYIPICTSVYLYLSLSFSSVLWLLVYILLLATLNLNSKKFLYEQVLI